ncbi:MAG: DUF4396 domain-containing protein [Steroidobacteraceae bacterium]
MYLLLMPSCKPSVADATSWFVMEGSMVFGFLTTCPVNRLLVKRGIKSGM